MGEPSHRTGAVAVTGSDGMPASMSLGPTCWGQLWRRFHGSLQGGIQGPWVHCPAMADTADTAQVLMEPSRRAGFIRHRSNVISSGVRAAELTKDLLLIKAMVSISSRYGNEMISAKVSLLRLRRGS